MEQRPQMDVAQGDLLYRLSLGRDGFGRGEQNLIIIKGPVCNIELD